VADFAFVVLANGASFGVTIVSVGSTIASWMIVIVVSDVFFSSGCGAGFCILFVPAVEFAFLFWTVWMRF